MTGSLGFDQSASLDITVSVARVLCAVRQLIVSFIVYFEDDESFFQDRDPRADPQ
jgi:hypothetical protein